MDTFRNKLFVRVFLLATGLLLACSLLLFLVQVRQFEPTSVSSQSGHGFVIGFQLVIFAILCGTLLLSIARITKAIRCSDKLKKLLVSETDERNLFIKQKTGSVGMNIAMYGLAIGTIFAAHMEDAVFFALFSALVFVTLIRVCLALYYHWKY